MLLEPRRFVSIDPGLGGALVFWEDGVPKHIFDMPVVERGSKRVVEAHAFQMLLAMHNPDKAVIEQVGGSPRMGVSSAFNFGHSFGVAEGVCNGYEISVDFITPQKWKARFGLLKKPKDAAVKVALDHFPHLKEALKLKKHIDRADAILLGLAWYQGQK